MNADDLEKENKQLKAILKILRSCIRADHDYNQNLIERLLLMNETTFDGIDETLKWRKGSRFEVLDSKGEHDPVYLVTPNGEMFELNHYNDQTTDLARAHWLADTLNEKWDSVRGARQNDEN